jgi:hypothetical protein
VERTHKSEGRGFAICRTSSTPKKRLPGVRAARNPEKKRTR